MAVSVSARASGVPTASAASTAVTLNPRIVVLAIMNDPRSASLILAAFPARSLTCLKTPQLTPE
jgi:hypothetical protein